MQNIVITYTSQVLKENLQTESFLFAHSHLRFQQKTYGKLQKPQASGP